MKRFLQEYLLPVVAMSLASVALILIGGWVYDVEQTRRHAMRNTSNLCLSTSNAWNDSPMTTDDGQRVLLLILVPCPVTPQTTVGTPSVETPSLRKMNKTQARGAAQAGMRCRRLDSEHGLVSQAIPLCLASPTVQMRGEEDDRADA